MKSVIWILSLCLIASWPICAQEDPPAKICKETEDFKERFVETEHQITIDGKEIAYLARVGNLILKDDKGAPKASVFFTSYTKQGQESASRPITFCFNGGPGSSSVWLHMGMFGPKRVVISEEGEIDPPYEYEDNPYSLLDLTDLVFVDPVSTGFSCAAPGEDPKKFHGVDEDAQAMASFIRLFVTRFDRWDSPKFLAGESYGTTRAAAVANTLHDQYYLYLNGLILVSSALNFQTFYFDEGNDLPYILFLPSYTATAWYHKKLPPALQQNFARAMEKSKEFAFGPYATALLKGDRLSSIEKEELIEQLAFFTGLPREVIERHRLRVPQLRFAKELLKKQNLVVGRFDSRIAGIDPDASRENGYYDPSADFIAGAFTSTFQSYLSKDLNWKDDRIYYILANVWPWEFGKAKNRYLNVASNVQDLMTRNPNLFIFSASGLYDLATPFAATEYTLGHLGLDPSLQEHITSKIYDAGHMMYLYKPALVRMKSDLRAYYDRAVPTRSAVPAKAAPRTSRQPA